MVEAKLEAENPTGDDYSGYGAAVRDTFYVRDQDVVGGFELNVRANDAVPLMEMFGHAGATLEFPSTSLAGSGLSQGKEGGVWFEPSQTFIKEGYDRFEYSYKVSLQSTDPQYDPPNGIDLGPGDYWYTNTTLVEVFYTTIGSRPGTGLPCSTCNAARIGNGQLIPTEGGTLFITHGVGGGGSEQACGCSVDGGTGGRSPDSPILTWSSEPSVEATITLVLPASNLALREVATNPPSAPEWGTGGVTSKVFGTIGGISFSEDNVDLGPLLDGESLTIERTVDISEAATGVYQTSLTLEEWGTEDGQPVLSRSYSAADVGVVANYRLDSEFGNRWNLDVLDRIIRSNDPSGAMLVTGDGATHWFPRTAGAYLPSKTDPNALSLVEGADGDTKFTLTHKDGSKQYFRTDGRIRFWDDRLGNRATFAYDANNRIQSITDYAGRDMTFAYGANGKVSQISDYANRVTTLSWAELADKQVLTSVRGIDPDGGGNAQGDLTQYSYDPDSLMIASVIAPDGETYSATFDRSHGVSSLLGTGGVPLVSFQRDGRGTSGRPVLGAYSPGIASEGNALVASSPGAGMTGQRIDALGEVWRFAIDANGYLVSETDPEGNTTRWSRSSTGLITSTVGADGATTTFEYDTKLNLVGQTLPDGTRRSWEYEPQWNRVTKFIDDVGGANRTTVFSIDTLTGRGGNVKSVTQIVGQQDPAGGESNDLTTTYDFTLKDLTNKIPGGLVKSITDPLGEITQIEYWSGPSNAQHAGRVKTVARGRFSAEVSAEQYEYDAAGNVTKYTDGLGRITDYVYDNAGRLKEVQLPNPAFGSTSSGPRIAYTYAFADYLASVTDETGKTTRYQYNRHRQVERVVGPDGDGGGPELPIDTFFLYDRRGSLLTSVEAGVLGSPTARLDRTSGSQYDRSGRMTRSIGPHARPYVEVPDTSVGAVIEKFVEDGGAGSISSGTNWAVDFDTGMSRKHRSVVGAATAHSAELRATDLTANRRYEVFATWVVYDDNATNVPYTVYRGTSAGTVLETIYVDQRLPPAAGASSSRWHSLGQFDAETATTLSVKITNQGVDGRVVVDNIRVVEVRPETRYAYDEVGRAIAETDSLGRVTNYEYDDRDQVVHVWEPDPGASATHRRPETEFAYDNLGRLVKTVDPLGRISMLEYDAAGQLATDRQPYASLPWTPAVDDQKPSGNNFSIVPDTTTERAKWTEVVDIAGHSGDYQTATTASLTTAQWQIPVTAGKTYEILATWAPLVDAATKAHFMWWNGAPSGTPVSAVVNQTSSPNSDDYGEGWHRLANTPITATGSFITVQLRNAPYGSAVVNAGGKIVADAIRLVEAPLDNGNTGFTTYPLGNTVWKSSAVGGHQNDVAYAAPSSESSDVIAEWKFTGLATGKTYEVVAGWYPVIGDEAASNAPFQVWNGVPGAGGTPFSAVNVNQRQLPSHSLFGSGWKGLGQYALTGGATTLTVRLNNIGANGIVLADSVRLIEVAAPEATYGYDKNGNVTSVIDSAGGLTQFAYDALGRLIQTTEPDPDGPSNPLTAPVTQYTFDAASQLKKVRDPLGRETTYQ